MRSPGSVKARLSGPEPEGSEPMKTYLSALAIASLASAGAAAAGSVSVELLAHKLIQTTDDTGLALTERQELETVLPGDRLVYSIALTNADAEPATELALALPVPEEVRLDPHSFVGSTEFSVLFATRDAPEVFGIFGVLTVPTDDGGTRLALPDDLVAARVEIAELAAAAEATVEYEATLR